MSEQNPFDELTNAIAEHNAAVAETIAEAEESLIDAKNIWALLRRP